MVRSKKVDPATFGRAFDLWYEVGRVRKKRMREVQQQIRYEQDKLRRELAEEISGFLRQGVSKGAICTHVEMSRPTLDKLLEEYGEGAGVAQYRLERGFRNNVWLKGELPDDGGYPELAGRVALRWADGVGGYVPVEGVDDEGARQFLVETYRDEVTRWHEQNPLG